MSSPRFAVMERQPVRASAVVLALVTAGGALWLIALGLGHGKHRHFVPDSLARSSGDKGAEEDDKDDPSQVDTIVLGDPGDAPVPARRGHHPSSVHPTVLIRLPHYGEQTGMIPNTPAGQLLFAWLAAFNHADRAALEQSLPRDLPAGAIAAQMDLRQQTGGFNLISAKEVAPGVLVFRLRDQTPAGTEALGTLVLGTNAGAPAIASFSLGAVPPEVQGDAKARPD